MTIAVFVKDAICIINDKIDITYYENKDSKGFTMVVVETDQANKELVFCINEELLFEQEMGKVCGYLYDGDVNGGFLSVK